MKHFLICIALFVLVTSKGIAQSFNVIAFFTAKDDQAHISFVKEANRFFPKIANQYQFRYDTTSNWDNLNAAFLANYQVVLFLDTRPEKPSQRQAFEEYMNKGGAWMGFHFAAFALNNSLYSQDWDWYHQTFLGSGQYKSNTWKPTSAILKVEKRKHFSTKSLPKKFKSSINEWYRWENDLRINRDIEILLSIDAESFPLGTGPNPSEIWQNGYYPVAWRNKKYRMLYLNMGHNDIDYENNANKELSFTFENDIQNRFVTNALLGFGKGK